jgi:hypothetical protein
VYLKWGNGSKAHSKRGRVRKCTTREMRLKGALKMG